MYGSLSFLCLARRHHNSEQSLQFCCFLTVFISLPSSQEIEQSMHMLSPNPELPDVSELVTKFFSGSKGSSKAGGSSKGTRPAAKRR